MQRSCGDSSNLVPAKCQRLVFCDTHPLCLPRQPLIVSGQANVVDQPSGLRQSPAPTKTSLILLPWWTSTSQLQSPSLSKTSGADCQPPRGRIFPRCKTRKTERGATQAAQNEQIPLNSFHSIHSRPSLFDSQWTREQIICSLSSSKQNYLPAAASIPSVTGPQEGGEGTWTSRLNVRPV